MKVQEKHLFFFRRIWPDWGYTTWADMAGLGSIGLSSHLSEILSLPLERHCKECVPHIILI